MKKNLLLSAALILLFVLVLCLASCGGGGSVTKLYVYNWGEYMSLEGGDDLHVNHAFEAWYEETYGEKIEVVYSVFASNEEMYAKLQNGSSKIDIIVPSEYMIERLIAENMLIELDFENHVTAYDDAIEDRFKTFSTAPYCVPYTYGYLGLIYDASVEGMLFDKNGETTWRTLWNELPGGGDLSGQILTFNNSRDAFGIAQFILNHETAVKAGVDPVDLYVNTADRGRWDEAYELLVAQKDCLQAYVMDEIYNKMEGGAALLAPYYAGDYFTMVDVNENLCFAYPKEGTNFFYDGMCVPKTSKHPVEAQRYMNFLLGGENGETLDVAIGNAEWVGYSSPNRRVTTSLEYLADMTDEEDGYGADALGILYPEGDTEALLALIEPYAAWRAEQGDDYDPADYPGEVPTLDLYTGQNEGFYTYMYENLDSETLVYANGRWEALKLASAPAGGVYVLTAVILVALAGALTVYILLRRYRKKFY